MPKHKVTMGELCFASKAEANQYFSAILNNTRLGAELIGNDLSDVMALLSCHPDALKKMGAGVKTIKVDKALYKTRCFHVIRVDGSSDNFSINRCIVGEYPPFREFYNACRGVVEPDLLAFKAEYFKSNGDAQGKVKCAITGEKIDFSQSHVDHREPFTFSAIVHFFIKANNITLENVQYADEGVYGNEFVDKVLAKNFKLWHDENAIIRIVKARENLSKGHLGRVKMTKSDRRLTA